MQQDNNPKYRGKSTTQWLEQKTIRLQYWPSQCPDLNPVELLWHHLKRAVHTRHPKNIAELKQFCKEEWPNISPDRCAGLIRNYKKMFG
jgi:transposase